MTPGKRTIFTVLKNSVFTGLQLFKIWELRAPDKANDICILQKIVRQGDNPPKYEKVYQNFKPQVTDIGKISCRL